MSLETLNEYTICEIFKHLDSKDLSNMREISENFYNIGKFVFLDKFSKENNFLKTYGNFSFKINSHFDVSKSIKEIVVDLSTDDEFLVTLIVKDENAIKNSSILKTVFKDEVYKQPFENLLVLNIDKGSRLLKVLEKFPYFENLKIRFRVNYQENHDPTVYSGLPMIKSFAIVSIVPHSLAKAMKGIEKLELWNTFDKFIIQQNSETLKELTIDHLSFAGPVGFQDKVVLDFKITSKLKVFNAIGVRCLECEEFLENQPDAKVNFYMCSFVNGRDDF
ncbi:hypothetical protein ACFFRR_010863 [Megaselia abdita]